MTSRRPSPTRRTTFAGAWLRAALGSAWALLQALPVPSSRPRVVRLAREFGYDHRAGPPPSLPVVGITDVVPDVPIRLREPVTADGNVSLLELVVLDSLIAARQPQRIFEIGTFDGRTSLNFAANAPRAMVHTLDLPASVGPALPLHPDDRAFIRRSQEGARGRRFHGTEEEARITQLYGDSAQFDYAPFQGAVDFVFVDGSHSYEYVLADSRSALAMAAPGSLIVWHDYTEWAGVTRALNELRDSDPRFAGLRHVQHTTLALLEA